MSARSISPGGSVVAMSDRISLASGSLPGTGQDNPLSPQQLGAMGKITNFSYFDYSGFDQLLKCMQER